MAQQNHHECIFWESIATAAGPCGVAWCKGGLAHTNGTRRLLRLWPAATSRTELTNAVKKEFPSAAVWKTVRGGDPEPAWRDPVRRFLAAYYGKTESRAAAQTPNQRQLQTWLDWAGRTDFQRQVLLATAAIAPGATCTYGQLAQRIGRPRAARAVGAALARNPWPVLIGCHRVIGASGEMVGFSAPGGIATKQRMLRMERI